MYSCKNKYHHKTRIGFLHLTSYILLHISYVFFPASYILLLTSCGGGKSPGGSGGPGMKATVVAVNVTPGTYTIRENFPATLTGNNIVQLRADVTGYLEAVRVPDGSTVKKGQPLYEIDKSRYVAAYNQANASLLQAQADLAQRQRDLERYQNLLQHDAISRQTVEQAATAAKTAEANVAAAKAALERAGTDVSHAIMRAPVSGKIGIAQVKVGDIVNAGQTLINTIVNEDPIYADFDVPQDRIHEFTGRPSGHDRRFLLGFTDGAMYPQEGRILTVNNIVDPQTGTIRVRLQFPNKEGLLKSGMTCLAVLEYQTPDTTLAVPAKAIMETLSEKNVYVIGPGNTLQLRSVVPGPQADTMQIINKGLKAGEKVVIEGLQKARPGDTVNVAANR
ncbi:membrane fusion protein (multidrug efflux system) [Chitinophaga japonensis]|uniref:Membrane fusion protein (Multidrug efflux system) n=2 Tax=Chitinophaga japonensis TaxID=104662 RepID=A0A562T142_CHIJA|nr:membrane fusion protein (multidrug efflux system) [Chitinophaga japonensis]